MKSSLNTTRNISKSVDSVLSNIKLPDTNKDKKKVLNSKPTDSKKPPHTENLKPAATLDKPGYNKLGTNNSCEITINSKAASDNKHRNKASVGSTWTKTPLTESNSSLKETQSDTLCEKASNDLSALADLEDEGDYEDEFYMYETSYNDTNYYARQNQIYNNLRAPASPAFFQPGFYQRSHTPQPQVVQDPLQPSHSQNVFLPQHYQQHQHDYFNRQQSYYTSWYGSTPSLRTPDRNLNRQSFYFN